MARNEIQIKVSPEMRELVDRLEKVDIGALLRERDELREKLAAIRKKVSAIRGQVKLWQHEALSDDRLIDFVIEQVKR